MRANRNWQPLATGKTGPRQRFKIIPFINRTGTKSWRVSGIKRDGTRVRENFGDVQAAQCKQVELQTEWLAQRTDTSIRATKLTETQLRLAENAFTRLGIEADHELLLAVDHWLRHGRAQSVIESPRLDDAFSEFKVWLDGTVTLRPRSKGNLRVRVNVFANSVQNLRIADITPDTVESFLAKRNADPVTRDGDKRALSRFFSWCIERPRRWVTVNPCAAVKIEQREKAAPVILTVDECRALLKSAENFKDGRLVPYLAVTMFAGLRPFEASRLTWLAVNLEDGEIRLEANQTKTGRPRVVAICPTLIAWLVAYKGREFYPSNWRKDFDEVKKSAGFGPGLKRWTENALRHTAVSHFFRRTGSYGQAAETFGNSEAIIKRHYQGRVSSDDTKYFFALVPFERNEHAAI